MLIQHLNKSTVTVTCSLPSIQVFLTSQQDNLRVRFGYRSFTPEALGYASLRIAIEHRIPS